MRISGEQGKGGRNRCVSSRVSAGGYTKVRADRTRLCAVSTRDLCRYTVPCQVAWFLWAPHALAACCNRHVRHAISWLCWLKTTAHKLPFVRQKRRGNAYHGVQLRLSPFNHRLPGCEAHLDVVQGTAACHHQSADALLPCKAQMLRPVLRCFQVGLRPITVAPQTRSRAVARNDLLARRGS